MYENYSYVFITNIHILILYMHFRDRHTNLYNHFLPLLQVCMISKKNINDKNISIP